MFVKNYIIAWCSIEKKFPYFSPAVTKKEGKKDSATSSNSYIKINTHKNTYIGITESAGLSFVNVKDQNPVA